MKNKELFEQIAKKHLGIETLKERGRDSLDFHDCSVLGIQDALQAAYEAGKQKVFDAAEAWLIEAIEDQNDDLPAVQRKRKRLANRQAAQSLYVDVVSGLKEYYPELTGNVRRIQDYLLDRYKFVVNSDAALQIEYERMKSLIEKWLNENIDENGVFDSELV